MSAQKGSIMYIADGTGTGAVAIAALRNTEFTINGQIVDVTNRDSAGYRELLSGAGISSVSVKGDGVITDSTSFGTLCDRAAANTLAPYTIHFGASNTLSGNFQLNQFDGKGGYNAEQTYSLNLESSGSVTRA